MYPATGKPNVHFPPSPWRDRQNHMGDGKFHGGKREHRLAAKPLAKGVKNPGSGHQLSRFRIPGINDYEVQRVALIKDVDKLAETEVVVVDTGSVIDPEFDTEALVRAVDDVFNTALGEYEHLLLHLAVPSYPATDKEDVASFARLRQLYKGRLFYFIASEEAYRWLTAQEGSQAKVTVDHCKGMYFYLRPSDYSRNGKRGRGRQQRPVGITRDDTVVQALEAKLGTFAEAVKAATASRGGRQLEGHQAVLNHVTKRVREAKMTGKTNIIQRLKRKLETGPEEWETKRQRIERMEAERARRNGELEEPGAEEGTGEDTWPEELDMQTQEEEIEILRMEEEEEALIEAQGVWATPQEGDGNMPLPTGKEAGMHEQEEDRGIEEEETRLKQEEGVTLVRGPPQGADEPLDAQQHAELRETRGTGPPETRDINMETQQEEEEELAAMAQQQEEAQEELVTMHEIVQQQAVAQREARLAGEWRRASMGKIRVAVQETPEKYMQHLKGDTAMHKLSNEYWKKGNEYLNEHDVTVLLRSDWMDSSHSTFPNDGKRVLLEFARRMIPAGDPFQGQADMLGIRVSAGVDPHDKISDFNAALKAARTRATLHDEDVKALFIKSLDTVFYQPVVSRLLLHDQRAAHDLLTIQQWVRECYSEHVRAGTATASAHRYSHGTHFMERDTDDSGGPGELADLRTMVLDLKRQLAAFLDTAESGPAPRGFTPRADKPGRRMMTRFAASPLPKGGNWSQSISKKVAFHRDTGATVPYCQNQVCAKGKARHWHRDCPNGGRTGLSAYAFAEEAENSVLAAKFQHAIDHDDAEEFDALCMLAGGKPDIFADLSACSFCEEDGEALVSAVTEFSELARTAGDSTFNINTFTADLPVVSEPPAHSPPASVESEEEWTGPPNPFCPPVTRTFADFIESTGIALVPDEPAPSMNLLSAVEEPERVMDYKPATYTTSDDDDEDASVTPPRPRYGCGNAIPGFGRSLLTSSLVCALFVICAAAAPHTVADVGGADWLLPFGWLKPP
ncbi:hypothetical protein CYMTET_26711 [Cymbomonas tetramitiformis]|uniref:Uncharacterized protein n=1 Tax=Cymbomonas tetramitiformis TaxID=36881 RepID=A0AAE0KXV7_9CHLO|nr:hypothetical protein CYMTET_26711 [Cymbomonas tetramitiformis]